jgi:glycine cleavage system H protein
MENYGEDSYMSDFLETTVDKFTFKVATDRFYTSAGLWAKHDAGRVQIGLTDFLQQRSGDVAFAEVKPKDTRLTAGDEIAVIETIKVDTILDSPVSGVVIEVNPAMEDQPEVINQDPYGEGWMVVVAVDDWEADRETFMEPETYFKFMKRQAEEEVS